MNIVTWYCNNCGQRGEVDSKDLRDHKHICESHLKLTVAQLWAIKWPSLMKTSDWSYKLPQSEGDRIIEDALKDLIPKEDA